MSLPALKTEEAPKRKYATRLATYDEREEIARLYVDNLWPIASLPPDMLTVVRSLYVAIKEGRVLVVTHAGKIVGSTTFMDGEYWFTPQPLLCEAGFFIIPAYRKTSAGARLLEALKAEARQRSAMLVLSISTKSDDATKVIAKRHEHTLSIFLVKP